MSNSSRAENPLFIRRKLLPWRATRRVNVGETMARGLTHAKKLGDHFSRPTPG
jgi:hypothetical protein